VKLFTCEINGRRKIMDLFGRKGSETTQKMEWGEEGYEKKRAPQTEQRIFRRKNKMDTSAVHRKKGKTTVL
jgi:hypothetical protein